MTYWVLVTIPACVCGIYRSTRREDIGIEAHLKDDVADRAHFFTRRLYCLRASRVTCNDVNIILC